MKWEVKMVSKRLVSISVVLLIAALLVVGAVVFTSRDFQLGYHTWRMQRARQQAYGGQDQITVNGLVGTTVSLEAEERFEHHCQKLVELGAIVERHYVFQHLSYPTDDSSHFIKRLVSGRCPNQVDFSAPYSEKQEPIELTVWCLPSDAKAWDRFVAEHDVADYHERFVARGGNERKKKADNGSAQQPRDDR